MLSKASQTLSDPKQDPADYKLQGLLFPYLL